MLGENQSPSGQTSEYEVTRMDDDLAAMSKDQLVAEIVKLRAGIRAHRDSSGHDLCWHHPALWGCCPRKQIQFPWCRNGRSLLRAVFATVHRWTSKRRMHYIRSWRMEMVTPNNVLQRYARGCSSACVISFRMFVAR